jgi:hypothetical protein
MKLHLQQVRAPLHITSRRIAVSASEQAVFPHLSARKGPIRSSGRLLSQGCVTLVMSKGTRLRGN